MAVGIGEKPETLVIGTFYNAAPGSYSKEYVEEWAIKAYPKIWAELLKIGKVEPAQSEDEDEDSEDEDEMLHLAQLRDDDRQFSIDRRVEA